MPKEYIEKNKGWLWTLAIGLLILNNFFKISLSNARINDLEERVTYLESSIQCLK